MIKKILTALLLCLIGLSSYGDAKPKYDFVKGDNQLSLKAQRTTRVLQKYFPNEIDREIVINTILEFVRERPTSKTSGWIDIDQIETLCTNGGYDLTKSEDQKKCINFVRAFVALTLDDYYEVCGKDAHVKGITAYCIDNVFYHENTLADTQVTMLEAVGLAKEYVRINANKYNNDVIECSDKYRDDDALIAPDYFIKCRSVTDPIYYEFKFDDVTESKDINITASVEKAICEMHGVDYIYATSSQTSTFSTNVTFYPAKCKTSDATLCSKINESMKRFGYNTKMQGKDCVISDNTINSESQLRTAFGINNKAFKTGYQLSAYSEIRNNLCEYIKKNANTTITSCECNYNRTQLIKANGVVDDVLTCYANGQPIDFVFDDLSEHNKRIKQGNMEAFNCTVLGGEYQGNTCFTPDRKLCEQIAAATISECPECAKAYFDAEKNACVLPNASKANDHQKKVNIGLIVGGAVVGAGIIIYTGGTGFAVVAVAVETIGAGMELGAQMHIDGVADEFFMKANNCNDAKCAEEILKEYFKYISRMTNDLQDGEKLGIDSKMATLVEMLPEDSQFLIDIVAGCYEENGDGFDIAQCDDGTWNDAQIIRAVGIGLQFTSVFASVGKWILGANRVQTIARKTPKLTNVLKKKIPGIKSKIAQKLSKGDNVLRSDGEVVKLSKASKYTGKSKGGYIGYLFEGFTPSDQLDVFIKQLEKEGYHIEPGEDYMNLKSYRIFSDTGSDVDIESLQKQFLANATGNDKNIRLVALGKYYDNVLLEPNSWLNTYKNVVTNYVLNDPDIMEAQRNWENMSEWDRYVFMDRTNRKIRHLVAETPLPVSYSRPSKGANASYGVQRLGSSATKYLNSGAKPDYDEYFFDPKNSDFYSAISGIVHENYHYSQDIGKSDIPKWLLDYNIDNYIYNTHSYMEYLVQPIERRVRSLGEDVAKVLTKKYTGEQLKEMHEIGIELQKLDEQSLQQLGRAMVNFIDTKTDQSLRNFRATVDKIKYDRYTHPAVVEYIKSFDNFSFWERCRDIVK